MQLVSGYGVWLTARQLDEAVAPSNGKAAKLMCPLLSVLLEPHMVAQSSALGSD